MYRAGKLHQSSQCNPTGPATKTSNDTPAYWLESDLRKSLRGGPADSPAVDVEALEPSHWVSRYVLKRVYTVVPLLFSATEDSDC